MFKLDKAAFMIDSGSKMKINATGNLEGTIEWKSSNTTVATVNSTGEVEGISFGDAIITAICKDTCIQCHVSVDYRGQNPTLPPTWGLFIPDGEMHVFDNRAYIFGSHDVLGGYLDNGDRNFCSTDYHVIYSDDLIHWVDVGPVVSLFDIPTEIRGEATRLWAPDAFKSPNGTYHLIACTNLGKYIIFDSNSPTGPFNNAREIKINGESIKTIDPGVLVDSDNRVYIAVMGFYIGELDPNDYASIIPKTYTKVSQYMQTYNEPFEGPSLRKRNDTYYYIYIQNKGSIEKDGAIPTLMGYMTSKNPFGPYEYKGVIISNYDYPLSANIHGSIEEFKGQWYVSYHMPLADHILTRVHCLDKLYFNEDGTIDEVLPTSSGVKDSFIINEKIQASSGVIFSGKRNFSRIKTRIEKNTFYDYPYAFFINENESIGYRYVNFTNDINNTELCVKTNSDGAVLELTKGSNNPISTIILPNTKDEWSIVSSSVTIEEYGDDELFIILKHKPETGDVKLDWIKFT